MSPASAELLSATESVVTAPVERFLLATRLTAPPLPEISPNVVDDVSISPVEISTPAVIVTLPLLPALPSPSLLRPVFADVAMSSTKILPNLAAISTTPPLCSYQSEPVLCSVPATVRALMLPAITISPESAFSETLPPSPDVYSTAVEDESKTFPIPSDDPTKMPSLAFISIEPPDLDS